MEAEDGHYYIVKFKNNPQHRRILVNELVASVFLNYLRLATPGTAIIRLTESFLEQHPDISMSLGTRRIAVEPGWHFGSRFPGDPDTMAVYDFIPDSLLRTVANRSHFLGVLVFDKWVGNADARQAIFFRARLRDWLPETEGGYRRLGFVTQMMDHGYIFDGPHWRLPVSPIQGLYYRPSVYEEVTSFDDFQPWLNRVIDFPEEVLDDALKKVPREWLSGDEEELEQLFHKLLRRRPQVPDLIRDCRHGRINPFPNWD